jgi:hypothetical protein
MEPRIFKAERDTQIVIEKKFTIKKGDDVTVTYLKDESGEIVFANVQVNNEFIGKFDLQELDEFLTIFFSEPI